MLCVKGYDTIDEDAEFKYLVKMTMDSVTDENVGKLLKERGDKQTELHIVKTTTIQEMWLQELTFLEEEYIKYKDERERSIMDKVVKNKKVKITKKKALTVDVEFDIIE